MSDNLVTFRPVFPATLPGRDIYFTTPAHAHPYLTFIAWVDPLALLREGRVEFPERAPATGPSLRDYRFEKALTPGSAQPASMPCAELVCGTAYPRLYLDHKEFIEFLAVQGAPEIPVAIRTEEQQYVGPIARAMGSARPVINTDALSQRLEQEGVSGTTYIGIDAMENFINANLDLCCRYPSNGDGADLAAAAMMLDQMIYHGLPGAWVDHAFSAESMIEGMHNVLSPYKGAAHENGVGAYETVDRFARLDARLTHYQGLYGQPMQEAATRVSIMTKSVAAQIALSGEAYALAKSELNDAAWRRFKDLASFARAEPLRAVVTAGWQPAVA